MEAIATASITSAFGNGFLSEFIRDTYSFLKDSSKYPQVQETILLLDLKNFIPLSHNLINFLEQQDLPLHIKLVVQQLKSSIQLIKDQLAFIQNTLTTHKNKFLHSIRPPSLSKHLQKLTVLKSNADKQLNYILHLLPSPTIPNDILQGTEISIKTSSEKSAISRNERATKTGADPLYSEIQELSPALSVCSVSIPSEKQDRGPM
jgi:hypothetical protein